MGAAMRYAGTTSTHQQCPASTGPERVPSAGHASRTLACARLRGMAAAADDGGNRPPVHVSSPGRMSRWRLTRPRHLKYATRNAWLGRPLIFCSPRSASTSDGSLGLLATQTLTFLFTDIEGSTALLARLGDGYAQVLADHHRLIRASLAAHGGKEVDTQGDAFFAVFSSPSACVAAAVEMQRAFLSHSWPAGERVRVRMGVHSGEASQTEAGLVGLTFTGLPGLRQSATEGRPWFRRRRLPCSATRCRRAHR